jgi:hypothetical protein
MFPQEVREVHTECQREAFHVVYRDIPLSSLN